MCGVFVGWDIEGDRKKKKRSLGGGPDRLGGLADEGVDLGDLLHDLVGGLSGSMSGLALDTNQQWTLVVWVEMLDLRCKLERVSWHHSIFFFSGFSVFFVLFLGSEKREITNHHDQRW